MDALPRITDQERRARLAVRHALAPGHRLGSVEDVVRAVAVLHATEAATVHLAVAARSEGLCADDVDLALYEQRSVVKQLAMRRTLFVFPRDLLPAAWGSASARVARAEAARVAKAVEGAGIARDGARWLEAAGRAVLERLALGPASVPALRAELPELAGQAGGGSGKPWDRPVNVAPWVLTHLGLRGEVVRARNDGHWRTNRPTWARVADWLGPVEPAWAEDEGYAELVRRWLGAFGPGREEDLVWWLGATKTAVRRALDDVGAQQVLLDDGSTGWVLADDLEPAPDVAPWAALLPTLDPTTMGWKVRDFYLPPEHAALVFDANGNAGTTAWWDGRVVGCWVQDPAGRVVLSLLEDPGAAGRRALEDEAHRLSEWLGGTLVPTIYNSPSMKRAREEQAGRA